MNFGNIYCRTTALGNLRTSKPNFMIHYYRKIKKFAFWYKKRDNIDISDIPDEADAKLETQKKVISWRRVARSIEKNDFYMKRLCFSQTKTDDEELRRLIHKWDNLLTEETVSDDKDLLNFIEGEVKKSDLKTNE